MPLSPRPARPSGGDQDLLIMPKWMKIGLIIFVGLAVWLTSQPQEAGRPSALHTAIGNIKQELPDKAAYPVPRRVEAMIGAQAQPEGARDATQPAEGTKPIDNGE